MVYQFKLRLAERFSLVVQVSGGALTRTSSVASIIKIKSFSRKLRVDTMFGAGLSALLFFLESLSFRSPRSRRSQVAMMSSSNLIERSFELAAGRCEDLTPLVYRRLFEAHPEARTMFRTEGGELVKGSMLALTIDAILDFAGERTGHFRLITSEISSHDAYGTPRELFIAFFGIIAQTLREVVGADWSDEIDTAWRKLLDDIEGFAAAQ
jgi:hemoglobin-like flavoprotein